MGLDDLNPKNIRISPPYGAHPLLYDAVTAVLGPRFKHGPKGEPAQKRRDDYLLGAALFIDAPDTESNKTRLYFAASMIARAPNRNVHTQAAIVNNYTSIVDDEEVDDDSQYESKIGIVAERFGKIEKTTESLIQEKTKSKSELVGQTLSNVRSGQSFLLRWGDAREEIRDEARHHGQGKYGL